MTAHAQSSDLVLKGARVYVDPQAAPIDNAVVVIRDGHIAAAGTAIPVPAGARVLDCTGKVVVAGFWNSHVHFENGWDDAAHAPAAQLEGHLQQMLTRWGFTTVWDLGSVPENTLALRGRIESGEVPGPQILMAGDIFPLHGHPAYLPDSLQLPEAATPEQATGMAQRYLAIPLDGIKLFTGAYMGDKPVINMPEPIVAAAVGVAHAQHKPVFAHPQNYAGVDNALEGGVDILAHTIPTENGFTPAELARMKQQHSALTPTLTLWTTVVTNPTISAHLVDSGVAELKAWAQAGGVVLFGTDVGFQSVYDTTQEVQFMGRALSWREVFASLTTAPSDYFHQAQKGRITPGSIADLVILDGDPAQDVANLARVHATIRGGKMIYETSPAR
ncbi:amidohydrolase family protein [Silvibacterium sp.]|uniref:amidohydrolase family protein n=1 Tax=Silvibacterium sp. TaxID=1964179 RepID=UPI0039E2984F